MSWTGKKTVTTGEDKVALLLNSLPPDVAEDVLTQLGPGQTGPLRARMRRLEEAPPPPEVVEQLLRGFAELLESAGDTYEPGRATVAAATPAAESSEPASASDPIAGLGEVSPDHLAVALRGESLPTVSLVLSCLDATQAGEVLKRLPPEVRRDVSVRLGRPLSANPELVRTVARAVLLKCRGLGSGPAVLSEDAKARKLAEMLRLLERTDRAEVLAALEQDDADTAARVKDLLYCFEDLLRIEDRSVQKLLGEFDAKTLALALKGAADEIREKVMNNLSKRARETLNEEIGFLGTVPSSQLKQAQKLVVDAIQRLDQAGELVMLE